MNISGSVALVSGANRGLGRAFARELVRRGAAKVYGAARDPAKVTEPGVLPVALDITNGEQVARVAAQCADVSLLVNNAGVLRYSTFTSAPDLDGARQEMEVNYFGTLRMCRAFAPVLAAAGGRGRPGRGAGRRAVPGRQGQAVPRPRAHLPAHPGILGRRGLRHQLSREAAPGLASMRPGYPWLVRRLEPLHIV
jgi:NAD(P)-dependent dehydrogenase (short-subunit alcohol dehydrogenase family)